MRPHPVPLNALLIAAATLIGCGGADMASVVTGTLKVTTSSVGPGVDSDGYTIRLDGADRGTLDRAATLELTDLAAGAHMLELGGVASTCTVEGGSARPAMVTAGDTADVAFTVTCSAVTGSVEVAVNTTGGSLDPDGYAVNVDGRPSGRVSVNGNLTIPDLAAGTHTVALGGSRSTAMSATVTAPERAAFSRTPPPGSTLPWHVRPGTLAGGVRGNPRGRGLSRSH